MNTYHERMRILEMIETGEITPDEGARRLDALNRGESPSPPPPLDRMQILGMIEAGEISAEEGARRLQEQKADLLEGEDDPPPAEARRAPRISEEDMEKWKRWWTIPLWVGLGIVILSGMWMNAAYQSSGVGFWFYCSWLPLLLGVLLMLIAGQSRTGRWLHVRVRQAPGNSPQNVAVSIPLPIRFTAWALRTFGQFITPLKRTSVDELILALEESTKETPFYVQVDEGENGEQVEVFIG